MKRFAEKARGFLKAAGAALKRLIDIDDVLTVGGVGMIGAGIWFIYWPAALIVMGLLCLSLGVLGARLRRRDGR